MAGVSLQSTDGPHCDHLVQVYREAAELAEAAATFFAAGFESGQPAVAIATAAHWPLIAERLARRGWEPDALEADGLLYVRDAELTLQAILDEDRGPFERKFHDVVGGLLREAGRRSPRRRVRAFGEMVDLLVDRGDRLAADVLERYWNELAAQLNFMLLCGYRLDLFDTDVQAALLPQIHRSHSRVLAGGDEDRFATAVERALLEVLGETDAQKVYAQIPAGEAKAPVSQLALMWMSAHMPRAATKVLALARSYYGEAAAA
jgi:hypothetical protein